MKAKPVRSSSDVEGPSIRISWKDEQSILAKWHMTEDFRRDLERQFSIPFDELPFVLRLYDLTDREEVRNDGTDLYTDFDINHHASEWILYGVRAGMKCCVELGIRMIEGRFYPLSRSENLS